MAIHDQIARLTIFFLVVNTITVALRIFVRTILMKGSFGWDDTFLIITYVGFVLYAAFGFETIYYGYLSTDSEPWHSVSKAILYNNATNDVCYIISATVKISVALVLYRLVERVYDTIRWILIVDIITCAILNTITTLILALGCMEGTPYTFQNGVCDNTNYVQEASYVIWDVFHVVLPAFMLWNLQMSRTLKAGVAGLFGIGLLAAVATVFRLLNYVEYFNSSPAANKSRFWYTDMICGVTEHGLSLFASSILALKPVVQLLSKSWTSLSNSLGSGRKSFARDSTGDGRVLKRSDWTYVPLDVELGGVGVRKDFSMSSKEYEAAEWLQKPSHTARINESSESNRGLVGKYNGRKASSEAGHFE